MKLAVGSICSGIEAASVAWGGLCDFKWFSEIDTFPCDFLKYKYPDTPNVGDMNNISGLIKDQKITHVDMICAGTPCQAFSLAGKKQGLEDDRGNLTLALINILRENDKFLEDAGKEKTILFWENVEGVLKDKTNAFVQFVSALSGSDELLPIKCSQAGLIYGKTRNVAWRILDAKYFGIPQQRKRIYLLAGGKDFHPENILFEFADEFPKESTKQHDKFFEIDGHKIEVFREYTDCLYSAYGTKWNGNAAAYNGSLFVFQNDKLRRLSPLECERLMGFSDNYTDVDFASPTARYQAVGNSWAVPVVKWLGNRLFNGHKEEFFINHDNHMDLWSRKQEFKNDIVYYDLTDSVKLKDGFINTSVMPNNIIPFDIRNIIDVHCSKKFYISPVGCHGILRRAIERDCKINERLRRALTIVSSQWEPEEIERVSRVQPRGSFSQRQTATVSPF
ncbi:MAG: DNA cytosine methyltransferase [Rickettsiales bacterium]|nr:DNA cytosine methyltransferase [Rickettsiales bacterium]